MSRPPALLLVALLACGAAAQPRPDKPEKQDAPDLASLGKKYGLDVVAKTPTFPVKTTHGAIDGAEADEKDSASYAAIFAFEWSLYPPELVKKT